MMYRKQLWLIGTTVSMIALFSTWILVGILNFFSEHMDDFVTWCGKMGDYCECKRKDEPLPDRKNLDQAYQNRKMQIKKALE
jgi:hypothetical protein